VGESRFPAAIGKLVLRHRDRSIDEDVPDARHDLPRARLIA
jgi:hypothetical protein